jgi:hypothetical protein
MLIANNTITGNMNQYTELGTGGIGIEGSSLNIVNNIISFGSGGISGALDNAVILKNNNVYGNSSYDYLGINPGPTDISADPLFIDAAAGDYRLRVGSPCVDAGENGGVPTDNTGKPLYSDIDGDPRIQKGLASSTAAIVDIGADEIDIHAPYTTGLVYTANTGVNGWYRTPPELTLKPSDVWPVPPPPLPAPPPGDNTVYTQGTGVALTEYSRDGVTWLPYTAPIVHDVPGEVTFYYRSTDRAGNVEPVRSRLMRYDPTPPQPSIALTGTAGENGWFVSPVTVTLSGSDAVSGVFGFSYSLDNVAWSTYTGPFTYSRQGQGLLHFRASDYAQNMAYGYQAIPVDTAVPAVSSTDPVNLATAVSRAKTVAVAFGETVLPGPNAGGIRLAYVNKQKKTVVVPVTVSPSPANPAVLEIRTSPAGTLLGSATKYTVTLPAGAAKDRAGNPSTAYSFSFTTAK